MDFRLWLEVKHTAETLQQIKDELESQKYSTIWLDTEGNVRAGYPEKPDNVSYSKFRKIYNNKVSINPDEKQIQFQMVGDKTNTAIKKLVQFLADNGIIDNTWKVRGGKEVSEYLGSKYTHFPDPDMPKTVADVRQLDTVSAAMNQITLYHGTSEDDWQKIQKAGALYPLFMGSNKEYGFESRFKHSLNKDLLYLATNADKAWNYAKTRAQGASRKLHKSAWQSQQYAGPEYWPVRPVLLRVTVPDMTKLRSDDDIANARMRNIAEKLWNEKSPEEQKEIMKALSLKAGFEVKDPSMGRMLWRDTDEGFSQILAKLNPKIYKAWLASMLRESQVAYKGYIPLRFIKEIPVFPRH